MVTVVESGEGVVGSSVYITFCSLGEPEGQAALLSDGSLCMQFIDGTRATLSPNARVVLYVDRQTANAKGDVVMPESEYPVSDVPQQLSKKVAKLQALRPILGKGNDDQLGSMSIDGNTSMIYINDGIGR